MFLSISIVLFALTATASSHTFQPLIAEQNRLYSYQFRANVSTGTFPSIQEYSYWLLEGELWIQVYDDYGRARLQLHDLKTQVHRKYSISEDQSEAALRYLTAPFEVDICFSSINVGSEPVWVTNMKRALALNFLVAEPDGSMNSVEEPCLYGSCVWVYSRVGIRARKYCAGVARRPVTSYPVTSRCTTPRVAEWRSRAPIDTDPNYLMTAERNYHFDQKIGMLSMDLKSEFQYKTHHHILNVMTNVSLLYKSSKPVRSTQKMNLTEVSLQYEFHNYSNPSNGIWNTTQEEIRNKTFEMLLHITREGIDIYHYPHNDHTKISFYANDRFSLDFIELLNSMSQLNYDSLVKLFEDVLGTSYELETARNIFLEVLPYVRTEDGAKLVKRLVVDLKNKIEDAMLVSLIRKLPYSIATFSRRLLEELEVFTKLGPEYPQDIRHAAILSFATMVSVAMEAEFDQQFFDDIYDKYLRMYNYCPQYVDRLVWLQGLANIGKNSVNYLDEIYTDTKKNRHERLWAAMASVSIWKGATLENTLPILLNETEHIQLRVVALHAILTSPLGPRDFFNVHDYLKECGNDQLQRFWYTTMRSLENNRFYDKYKSASYYIPFLAAQLTDPGMKEWATNNFIISQEPSLDVQSPTFQLLTVGGRWSGPPELLVVEFSTGGELAFNGAVYIVAEGVTSNVFRRIQTSEKTEELADKIMHILEDLKVEVVDPERVHIDVIVKVYDKIVYATHINQQRFDGWNVKELRKSIDDFVRFGSHINQQIVYYPSQMAKDFPTEIGTPVRLLSTVVSFASLRGNLTAPSTDDLTWRNDLHIRYQGTSVISLSIDGPLQPSQHTVRFQQSLVVHLPMKFDVKLSPETRAFKLKWTSPSQNGSIATLSRTQIATQSSKSHFSTSKRNKEEEHGVFFDCENRMASSPFRHSSKNKYTMFGLVHTFLRSLTVLNLGLCGAILPVFQQQAGNSLEINFKIDEWNDVIKAQDSLQKVKASFGLDYYSEKKVNRTNYFSVKGTVDIESDGTNGTVGGEINVHPQGDGNFSICYSAFHHSLSPFNVDFTDDPAAYKGGFALYFSNNCDPKADGDKVQNKFDLQYENHPIIKHGHKKRDKASKGDRKRELRVAINGKELMSQLLLLSPDIEMINSLGYLDAFVLLSKNTLSPTSPDYHSAITIKEEGNVKLVNWNDVIQYEASKNAWLPPSMTLIQAMKNLGFYHECQINQSTLVSGKQLVIGDCTNKPRFAVIRSSCEDCKSAITTDHNTIVYTTGHSLIKSVALDDFKVHTSKDEYVFRSQLTGVLVYHSPNVTKVLVPQAYMNTACGVCMRQP